MSVITKRLLSNLAVRQALLAAAGAGVVALAGVMVSSTLVSAGAGAPAHTTQGHGGASPVAASPVVGVVHTHLTDAVPPRRCPWLNDALPVATRVDELLKAMTPLEEATLLHLQQPSPTVDYEGFTPGIPRLCIPVITEQDGAAGVAAGFTGVTQLPAPIVDAAAFDPTLAGRYGSVMGAEEAGKGVDLALSPTINIDRSPLWGRSYETLGEDPYLTASLAVPLVEGIQSHRVVAVVKHFAVYNQETHRSTPADDSIVSNQALHEIYLPAFGAVTQQAHAGALMCSYNLINGTPACQNKDLIDGILRGQWQFGGFVRSDCDSIYNQTAAIAVGVSQAKCTSLYNVAALAASVTSGKLRRAVLDALARPLLTVLFEYNLIASPHPRTRDAIVTSAAHSAVALAAADEGAVLLKNQADLLPLHLKTLGSLALIGPAGGTPMPAGFGAVHVQPSHPVSALAALRAVMGSRLHYDPGTDIATAVAIARTSSAAIVVVNDVEAETLDRPNLNLPSSQNDLVSAIVAANPHTIVVLETGSAVLMPWLASVPAVLETWYPGEVAGTSLVDLLSGRADPSGKLPVTFPASESAMPDNTAATFGGVDGRTLYSDGVDVGYRWYEANNVAPAFWFGYGLSYTQFEFSGLHAVPDAAGDVVVTATITNTGPVAGADVVQCYVGEPASTGDAPRQLRSFARVMLRPGASRVVTFTVTPGDLASWVSSAPGAGAAPGVGAGGLASGSWLVTGGGYGLWVGDGSDLANLPLHTTVALSARNLGVDSGPAPAP